MNPTMPSRSHQLEQLDAETLYLPFATSLRMSDPVRLEIVRCLAGVAEATCGELDGGRPKSSMSHHFRVLRDAGLVQTRSVGTTHMNSLRSDVLESRFPGLLHSILAQH